MRHKTYPGPDTIHRQELANGITVLVYENFAAESVVIEGFVRAGSLAEGRARAGLADFTAEMLLRGTSQRSFDEIYEVLESVGAVVDFASGRHTTDFSATSLAEDLDLALALLAGSLREPTFPADELLKVQGEILTSLQIREHDTRQMAGLKFRELLYGEHPYGYSAQGYVDTIQALQRDDLVAFHRRHYGPQGMVIVLVGAVRAADGVARVQAAFGDWTNPNWQAPPLAPDAPRPGSVQRLYHAIPDKTQSDIVLGWPGPRRAAPDYMAASVANTILGVFGMMGRLGKSVREKQGLAYYAYSRMQGGLGPSPWYVSTGVSPDKVEQALASILAEVDRLRDEPVPAGELADTQAYRTGSLPVSLETNDGLAGVLADIELYELGLDYLQRFPDLVNSVTPDDVQAAARKYLSSSALAIAVVGPPLDE